MREGAWDVIVVGSLHLDIVVKAKALPAIDETARGSSWHMVCGGKGGNQACWASRLGARTAMISRIGQDDFGTRLQANLRAAGVNVQGVGIDPGAGSGMSVAIVQDNGDYGAVIVSGSNLAIKEADVISAMQQLGTARIMVLQNEVDEAINIAAASLAKNMQATVLLNAAPARALSPALARNVDVLVVNRVEAEMMSGETITSPADVLSALPRLHGICPTIVVTLGGQGLVVAEIGQQPAVIEAVPVTVASTHGAGDCFIGSIAQSLAKGLSLHEACMVANKTAASYVSGQQKWGTG